MVHKLTPNRRQERPGFTAAEIDEFRKQSLLADAYQSPFPGIRLFHRRRTAAIIDLLAQALRPPGEGAEAEAVLEFGCGDGFLIETIARVFPGADIRAVDISLTALERARNRAPTARLVQSDAARTPFPDGSVPAALCSEVIEHVPDDTGLLREIFRVLRPGGDLVLTTPNLYTLRNILRQKIGREPKIEIPEHLREYGYRELSAKIRSAGFVVVRFRSVGFYIPKMHWIFKSKVLSGAVFLLARIFPRRGRDFMFLLRKPPGTGPTASEESRVRSGSDQDAD
ncbi:MAG TPA: class I SAM-dependent methyltransferase [bacterium]|nr:class I SAM-dependent methyltransferase [bacterium]HPJ72282.1 class I SAM-dependent methyltransferase [bacterium]HPQ65379.1 class I SAM-dependent methyltransferase [bacterium]